MKKQKPPEDWPLHGHVRLNPKDTYQHPRVLLTANPKTFVPEAPADGAAVGKWGLVHSEEEMEGLNEVELMMGSMMLNNL